ncbi:hypothetical protein [Pseudoxanthomonas indica]|uniref:Uncharacterized protein n=1 Tax=Pseudoxanthomonas indica TaxID=428993 RepID=A0A1T5J282_9GAMM|nr:hypothetical protein [Pseudoxanthomonas indica]GGD55885.1 hypothetical protein GCM10007235_30330 [Pseudoxanthomonas indica]SKC45486.1 hypothetical protein SAMN06296058_0457 [Pseudoxanthomonas indica]
MASINPTVTTPQASSGGNFHFLPPFPPAAGPSKESPHDKIWTVQETLHLLYLLTLARDDDPIIAPEQWQLPASAQHAARRGAQGGGRRTACRLMPQRMPGTVCRASLQAHSR